MLQGLREDGGDGVEDEALHGAEEAGVVGVDADEQADPGPDEEVHHEEEGDDLHSILLLIVQPIDVM